ncbi:T9SS type A sorting domain-containing protein [Winogradskyella sp. A2]|uniref:T9SS type A sorting domain-containing protein n=1 Tax=Winogradskyella sp. A2 TaxID=3366944 RepID=UPI00398C5CC5
MKRLLLFFSLTFFAGINAQQYTFGIISDYNGTGNPEEITFVATPDFTNANPEYSDIRVTMAITSGIGLEANSLTPLFGTEWTVNVSFTGLAILSAFGVGDGSKDLLVFTLPAPTSLLTQPSTAGIGIPMFSVDVGTVSEDWVIEILDNNDPIMTGLASNGFTLSQTINVDLNDGNLTQDYYGGLTPGGSSFVFDSLGTAELNDISTVSIYPNPAKDALYITGLDREAEITVIDLSGRIVLNVQGFTGSDLDISRLEVATYLLEIKTDDQVYKTRFIKN